MATRNINIVYRVNKKELDAARTATDKAKKSTQDLGKEIKGTESVGTKAFRGIGAAIAAIGIATLGRQIINVTAEFQKFGAVLTNTLGSRSQAQKAFTDIRKFAAETPFSVQEITASFVKLANQGFKPTLAELKKLGDLAAAQGKGFDQLTEAIIDAQTGEFERLKEFGIRASKAGDQVSFTFKGVKTQTDFTSESIRKYVLSLGDLSGVAGGMAAISATLGGKISNFGDNIDSLFASIGNSSSGLIGGFLDLVNNGLGALNNALNDNIGNLQEEQFEINSLVKAATNVNTSTEVRAALIDELNQKYPDFLKNLDKEKVTNEQLTLRLDDVNKQFIRKIALVSAEKELQKIQDQITASILRERDARKEIENLKANRSEIESRPGGALGLQADVDFKIQSQQTVINSQIAKRNKLSEELESLTTDLTKALDLYTGSTNDYFDATEKAAASTSKFNTSLLDVTESDLPDIDIAGVWANVFANSKGLILEANKELTDELHAAIIGSDEWQRDQLVKAKEKEIEEIKEANDKKLELEKEYEDHKKKIKREAFEFGVDLLGQALTATIQSSSQEADAIQYGYNRQIAAAGDNERAKEELRIKAADAERIGAARQAKEEKDRQIKQMLIQTLLNAIRALASWWPASPAPNWPAAGRATAYGLASVGIAKAIGFKDGVIDLQGPGTETSDSIPTRLSKHESVMTAAETRNSLGILKDIRARKLDDKIFDKLVAKGGSVVANMDDRRIVSAIEKSRVNLSREGTTLYEHQMVSDNFTRKVRAKIISR